MKIALVGIPIEEVPIQDEFVLYCATIPGITDPTREQIMRAAKQRGIDIADLGEVRLGGAKPRYKIDRLEGIPSTLIDTLEERDLSKLEQARNALIKESKHYDLLVATGPSHLGAITLYESEKVARLDYHSDYAPRFRRPYLSHASYMNWVENNLRADVDNYFVRDMSSCGVYGKQKSSEEFEPAGHFDIDIDCFNASYQMQRVYAHTKGPAQARPEIVLDWIARSRPSKIGIWEYRPEYDAQKKGLDFIVSAIAMK